MAPACAVCYPEILFRKKEKIYMEVHTRNYNVPISKAEF